MGRAVAITVGQPYWHPSGYNMEGRLTRQPNPSGYRKAESLRGADLRRFLDSNTSPAVFGSINHVDVSPNGCMTVAIALVPGTGGIKMIDAEQRDERTTTQTDGKATCCAPYQSHG